MNDVTPISYLKSRKKTSEDLKRKIIIFDFKKIFIIITGLLMGFAELFTNFYLFPLLYWNLFVKNKRLLIIMTLAIGTGLYLSGACYALLYLFSGIFAFIIYNFINKRYKINSNLLFALISSGTLLIILSAWNYYYQVILYKYLFAIVESLLLFFMILIAKEADYDLMWKQGDYHSFKNLLFLILSSALLVGIYNFPYFEQYIINIIVYIYLINFSRYAGFADGIIVTLLYTLILISAGIIPLIISLKFILIIVVSGYFSKNAKIYRILSLIIAFLLYSGFSPSYYDLKFTALEILLASFIIIFVPDKYFSKLFMKIINISVNVKDDNTDSYYPDFVEGKFDEIKEIFQELSKAFNEVLPEKKVEQMKKIDDFIYIFKNKNCKKCKRRNICWEKGDIGLKSAIASLLEEVDEKAYLDKEMVKKYIGDKCLYYEQLLSSIKSSYEIYQINSFWRNKFRDRQLMVSRQLRGISDIIDNFSNLKTNKMGNKIRKIEEYNSEIYQVEIDSPSGDNKYNIKVNCEPCAGNNPCENQILHHINKEFNNNFRIIKKKCGSKLKDNPCEIIYAPEGDYSLDISIKQISSTDDICGDTYLYKKLHNGNDLIIVSDGMGVGEIAARESKTAVTLIKKIVQADFSLDLAINTINSALFLRSYQDKFTTLDIAYFNTFTAEIVFKKIGSVASFIKRAWEVKKIKSSSFPAGIFNNININTKKIKLQKNDFVIMLSDGVLDSYQNKIDKEEWLYELLRNSSFERPDDLRDYILENATENYKFIKDDITLIVMKVL